jgi:hypothetical protein
MESREAFQAESFNLILSAIGCRWQTLGFPLGFFFDIKEGKSPLLVILSLKHF